MVVTHPRPTIFDGEDGEPISLYLFVPSGQKTKHFQVAVFDAYWIRNIKRWKFFLAPTVK